MPATTTRRVEEFTYEWEARDRQGRTVRGELRAAGENQAQAGLRRQGLTQVRLRRRRLARRRRIRPRDIALFTRQLATMMRAGVPLLQAFDIAGRGSANPALVRLLQDIRMDVETGTALSAAFRKHPAQFPPVYCNLVEAGEAAGILDGVLERLATDLEKTEGLKSKVRSALMYPVAVMGVAAAVVAVIMVFVVPAFQAVFLSFNAELPWPTQVVIDASQWLTTHGWLLLAGFAGGTWALGWAWRTRPGLRRALDRLVLKWPVVGPLVLKTVVARWTRTLSTMFAAGVPLVEALESVGGAAGNSVFSEATERVRHEVSSGSSLAHAMTVTRVFPTLVLQMTAIGEEAGSLDAMLAKAADLFEAEVDALVAGLSSLIEPAIIVVLGLIIGSIVVAMYLPIFQLGQVA
jgi:type IV pilus assembly protein PilC